MRSWCDGSMRCIRSWLDGRIRDFEAGGIGIIIIIIVIGI
jgi:hypothetical protein